MSKTKRANTVNANANTNNKPSARNEYTGTKEAVLNAVGPALGHTVAATKGFALGAKRGFMAGWNS